MNGRTIGDAVEVVIDFRRDGDDFKVLPDRSTQNGTITRIGRMMTVVRLDAADLSVWRPHSEVYDREEVRSP